MAPRLERAVNISDLRNLARKRLPAFSFDYVDGSADDGVTSADNRKALEEIQLLPRQLAGFAEPDLSARVLTQELAFPLIVAPTGYNGLLRRHGDLCLARAASAAGIVYTQSTMSSSSVEEVAAAAPDARRWFQLYVLKDRAATKSLVDRAFDAGCEALVVTTDVAVLGNRERDRRHFIGPQVLSLRAKLDVLCRPRWWMNAAVPNGLPNFGNLRAFLPKGAGALDGATYIAREMDGAMSWDVLDWLRDIWPRKLVVKGLLHPEDVAHAVRAGADAIIVSNHGGRQLDGVPSPVRVIGAIREKIGDDCEVLMDSGIRRGSDILKAIACGAVAVLAGRAVLYGLAAGGEAGAAAAISILRAEFARTMALTGAQSVADIGPSMIFDDPAEGVRPPRDADAPGLHVVRHPNIARGQA